MSPDLRYPYSRRQREKKTANITLNGMKRKKIKTGILERTMCDDCSPLSRPQDHKPNRPDEMERIKLAGGMVIHKRVMGELAVSRAFGDRAFKMGIKVRRGSVRM